MLLLAVAITIAGFALFAARTALKGLHNERSLSSTIGTSSPRERALDARVRFEQFRELAKVSARPRDAQRRSVIDDARRIGATLEKQPRDSQVITGNEEGLMVVRDER
jgi:hypothetical protein